jgi:sortase (surface protein transpeptidase)
MLSARRGSPGRLVAALMATTILAACGNVQASEGQPVPRESPGATTSAQASAQPAFAPSANQLLVQTPLVDPGMDLRAGPVNVPLELRIPSLRIGAPVLAVGLTPKNVMATPTGSANDPVWRKVFWYRGGGIPGDATTATIAGHVDDVLGRPAIFAHLKDLRRGDRIVVHDTQTNVDVEFLVTATVTYTLKQTLDHTVLSRIYGSGPADGQGPQPSPDGLAHLTLMTCAGHWITGWGTFDQRLAVYAESVPLPLTPGSPHGRA